MTVTMGYAESSGGVRIFFATERGQGTPLLVSHALLNPGASTIVQFEPCLAFHRALAGGASFYVYECRNSGRSSHSAEQPTFEDLVDDLDAVASLIGEPFDVYGRADGCALAVAIAARHPASVRRLLLVSALRIQHQWKALPEYTQRVLRRFGADPVGTLATHLIWAYPGLNGTAAFEAAKHHMEAMPLDVGRVLQRAFVGIDLLELGSRVRAPALVLNGEHEMEHALEAARCLPGSRVESWHQLGNGSVNGAEWRRAWDEMIPPGKLVTAAAAAPQLSAAALSTREAEILALICEGLSNAEIGERLVIAPSTAKRHVANIFAKLGVESRPQAIALAYAQGLVPAPTRRE